MGSEIIFPMAIALACGAILFLSLGLLYALLFPYRNSARACRAVLRGLSESMAFLLLLPTVFYVFLAFWGLAMSIFGDIEPSSDRFGLAAFVLAPGAVLAAVWWGFEALFGRLEDRIDHDSVADSQAGRFG